MEIRNLNTFLKVADLQSFTKAAQELGYSQSNISAQIKQLEEEVGALLFNRIGKAVTLTQYGEGLLPLARQIVSLSLQMESFWKSETELGGTIRIGMVESLFDLLAQDVIIAYHRQFPHVKVELVVDAAALLKDRLLHGTLDAACLIDDPLPQTNLYCWHKVEVPVVVIAHPQHALSQQNSVTLHDLSDRELILMEESASYSMHFHQIMAVHGIEIAVFLKMQDASMARRLVEKELFLSVLPLYTVKEAAAQGRIKILDIPEYSLTQSVQIVSHANKVLTPQVDGFMRILRTGIEGL